MSCLVFAAVFLFTCGLPAGSAQTTPLPTPKVMVAPYVPRFIVRLHLDGTVVVDVEINSEGRVTSTHVLEGHFLLRKAVENAAQQWTFEAGKAVRTVRLTFVYASNLFEESTVVLVKPYGVKFNSGPAHLPGTVSWLPEGFREGKSRCKVHGTLLKKDRVQIIYGLVGFKVGYLEAQKKFFPNSSKEALGGCIVESTKFAEVAYCPKCRRAEARWNRAHRHEKRFT